MRHKPHQVLLVCLLAVALSAGSVAGQQNGPGFGTCKTRIQKILNGTEIWRGIDNETIGQYLYHGPVRGMNPDYQRMWRENFTTLTIEGCKFICEDPLDWYWTTDVGLTLATVSNWVLPIMALLAVLPYDSLHRKNDGAPWSKGRFLGTISALLHWLGSPQTALTSTLFNIHQVRKCFHATLPSGSGISGSNRTQHLKKDAYYVLSCIGQFKLPKATEKPCLDALLYGLFRPFVGMDAGEAGVADAGILLQPIDHPGRRAEMWTTELVQEMAFQLRMLRRRGVYPAFVSVFLFFVAYAVALVLAFANVGERRTAHSLALGILVSWLPLLVIFTILDRNPVSADRSRKLMARWLWNVNAVRLWEMQHNIRGQQPPAVPNWWSQHQENLCIAAAQRKADPRQNQANDQLQRPRAQGDGQQQILFDTYISEFVGQGRQVGYNGLAYAVLVSVYNTPDENRLMQPIREIVTGTRSRLKRHRPASWWLLTVTSLVLIWLEIGMAIMISYNTPTVGLSCRSGSYVLYGILSTLPWIAQLLPPFTRPGTKLQTFYQCLCLLSTLSLGLIIFAAFSGVFTTCACKGGLSGYLDLEDARLYRNRDQFDVEKWWKGSAIVGALPMLGSVVAAVLLLVKLKPLWQASEQHNPQVQNPHMDVTWLV